MSKHTPSFWEITEEDYGDELWFGGKGAGMIFVNGWANGGNKNVGDGSEWEALKKEAMLIAAAPDLLALLIELIDIEGPKPGTSTWAMKVRAAIAKAIGEKS